jgi:2-polyprenyl-3-methyl-5-hydroxy-6-metoxy-1,4-benzoquinol methylase
MGLFNRNLMIIFLIIFIFSIILVYYTLIFHNSEQIEDKYNFLEIKTKNNQSKTKEKIEQLNRNLIEKSKKLHKRLQIKGQLECDKSLNDVSNSGGWCSKISGLNSKQHMIDIGLAIELSSFLKQKKVASFGDGPGAYKLKLDELKQVILYDAFDGAPYVELTTNNRVNYIDLSVPIYHLNKYDWIISLEVAEHIPAQFESIYIDNLVKHAKEGIILSWAKEGQDGHSHVNNKNADYVIKLMKSKNFSHDLQSSNNFKIKSSLPWFKDNINVFRRNYS